MSMSYRAKKKRPKSALPARSYRIDYRSYRNVPTSSILSSGTSAMDRIIDPAYMKYERPREKNSNFPDLGSKYRSGDTTRNSKYRNKVYISLDKAEIAKRFRKKVIRNKLKSSSSSNSSGSSTTKQKRGRKGRIRRKRRTQRSRTPGRNILFLSTTTTTTTREESKVTTTKKKIVKGVKRKKRKKNLSNNRGFFTTTEPSGTTSTSPPLVVNYMVKSELSRIKEKRKKMKNYRKMMIQNLKDHQNYERRKSDEVNCSNGSSTPSSNSSSSSHTPKRSSGGNSSSKGNCDRDAALALYPRGRPKASHKFRKRKARPPTSRQGRNVGSKKKTRSAASYASLLQTVRSAKKKNIVNENVSNSCDFSVSLNRRQKKISTGPNNSLTTSSLLSSSSTNDQHSIDQNPSSTSVKTKVKVKKKPRPKTAPRYRTGSRLGGLLLGNVKHLPPVRTQKSKLNQHHLHHSHQTQQQQQQHKQKSQQQHNQQLKFTIISPPVRKNSTGNCKSSSYHNRKKNSRSENSHEEKKMGSGICLRRQSDAKQMEKFNQDVSLKQLQSYRFGDQNDEWKNYSQIDLHIDTIMYEYFVESTMSRYRQVDLIDRFFEHVPSEVMKKSYKMKKMRRGQRLKQKSNKMANSRTKVSRKKKKLRNK